MVEFKEKNYHNKTTGSDVFSCTKFWTLVYWSGNRTENKENWSALKKLWKNTIL